MADELETLLSVPVGQVATLAGRAFIVRKITMDENGYREVTLYERDPSIESFLLVVKADDPT